MVQNQVMLVGKIVNMESNEERVFLTLSASKNYKNDEDFYENVLIPCLIGDDISNVIQQYCKEEDIVSIRGSLEKDDDDKLYVFTDKVTVLKSNSNKK